MMIGLEGNYPPFFAGLETQLISNQYKFNSGCRSYFAKNFCSLFIEFKKETNLKLTKRELHSGHANMLCLPAMHERPVKCSVSNLASAQSSDFDSQSG